MSRQGPGWLRLLLALLAMVGCQGQARDADARRVVPTSTADATEAVTDQGRGFRLAWPGPGWKLLGETDARQLHPDAAAGAMSEGGIAAVVVVRAAPPVELPTYTDELIGSMPLEEKKITLHERATVGARAAQRFQLRGKIDGVELRYSGLVVAGDGALVRVMAWQSAAMPCPSDRCFAPLFDAFSLLDGGPRAVAAAPAPPAADHGVGWRLKETAYESAISGLRVRPPPGWSLLLGANLERNNPAAEVGLVAPDAGLTLLFGSKLPLAPASGAPGAPRSLGAVAWAPAPAGAAGPRPPFGASAATATASCPVAGPAPSGSELVLVPGELGGNRIELRGGSSAGADSLGAALLRDGRCIDLEIRYPSAGRDRARALLAAGLGAASFLSAAEVRSVSDELQQSGDGQNEVGPDFGLRNGSYRNFRWRLTWTKPEGPWRIKAASAERSPGKGALLEIDHRGLGLHAWLSADAVASGDQRTYHQQMSELRGGLVGRAFRAVPNATIDGVEARASETESTEGGMPHRYRLVTTLRETTGLQLFIWGPSATMAAHADDVAAVTEALRLRAALTPVEQRAEAYRDHRLGFEISPPAGWIFADLTPPELAPLGTFVRWERDGRWVGIVAACLPEGLQGPEWFVGLLEQLLREAIGPLARGAARQSETRLAGNPAHHVAWQAALQRVDAALTWRDNTVFALVTVDRSEESFRSLAAGLVLLP